MPASITVAIPTRDRTDLLRRTIASVLAGSRQPDQLLVVDNSQRDPAATRAVCDELGGAVTYVAPIGDLTMMGNHNRARALFDSDLGAILQDDDLYGPDFVARAVAAFEANPAASLFAVNYAVVDGDDAVTQPRAWADFPAGVRHPQDIVTRTMTARSPVHLSAAVARSAAAKASAFQEADGNCADMGYFLRIMAQGDSIFVDEPLASVRMHESMESMSAGFFAGSGRVRSTALSLVPLEWGMRERFLATPLAATALGTDVAKARRTASRTALRLLAAELRDRRLAMAERLRIVTAMAKIVPTVVWSRPS